MPPIDVFKSLREYGAKVGISLKDGKAAITVRAPVVIFDPNQKKINRDMAQIIADECRDSLLDGKRPDGMGPMPSVTPKTKNRRTHLEEQSARGGQAAPHYDDPEFREEVADNWASKVDEYENFQAKRKGDMPGRFDPKKDGPRGVVSGLLAHSFLARPKRDGRGFVVFVAAARAAALARVFAGLPVWSEQAQSKPTVRAKVKTMAGKMVIRSAGRLGSSLAEFLRNVEELAGDVATDE